MAENVSLTTFNGGVLTPKVHDRIDIEKYASGCRRLENFLVLKEGGVERRPGTEFIYASTEYTGGGVLEFNPEETYTEGDNYGASSIEMEADWLFQTFTTEDAITCSSIKLLMSRTDTPGNVIISIHATNSSLPDGAALATSTVSIDSISEYSANEWVEFTLDTPVELDAATEYAICLRKEDEDSVGAAFAWLSTTGNLYTEGSYGLSGDGGSSFSIPEWAADYDMLFQVLW